MKDRILSFFKSDSLWNQIIGTIIGTTLLWIFTVIIGLFRGLDYNSSVNWTWKILTSDVDFFWILILVLGFIIYSRMNNARFLEEINKRSYSKEEINSKFNNKLDVFRFEQFEDVYDYRRLKKHPWHEQYSDNVVSFINILKEGNRKADKYKIENGICGLTAELKERGWLIGSEKNEIKQELANCFSKEYNHHKEDLEKLIDSIRII